MYLKKDFIFIYYFFFVKSIKSTIELFHKYFNGDVWQNSFLKNLSSVYHLSIHLFLFTEKAEYPKGGSNWERERCSIC